ncbi:MAG TPA: alpha/beta fold hydrolase [Deltaproteobacteria bacterium]|jgi:pimeloyl-ACP methyl ester carboxylesterase|nr:alpha/beta fold hydrolase [Deltaproteobacteria bacterium]HOI07112.1 alpha/beta fold hydrolase [Deltaproteobacteria bacterium]
MRRAVPIALALFISLSLCGCAGFKRSLFDQYISLERWRSSMVPRTIQVNDLSVSYLERDGGGETIVLLHGFSAEKDNWVRFVKHLPPRYRVIAIDLPGHGMTTRNWKTTYSIDYITQGFANTVDALKLERFHLAGNSMGGFVSTLYGASHPDRVLSILLMNPSGTKSPEKSDREIAIEHGINPLVPKTMDGFESMLEYVFHKQPDMPWPARSELASRYLRKSAFSEKVWSDIQESKVDTALYLKDLHMPVLIMWGDRDRIIHVSTVHVFQKGIPQAQTVIFKDCGHLPMLELPIESAQAYSSFLMGLRK